MNVALDELPRKRVETKVGRGIVSRGHHETDGSRLGRDCVPHGLHIRLTVQNRKTIKNRQQDVVVTSESLAPGFADLTHLAGRSFADGEFVEIDDAILGRDQFSEWITVRDPRRGNKAKSSATVSGLFRISKTLEKRDPGCIDEVRVDEVEIAKSVRPCRLPFHLFEVFRHRCGMRLTLGRIIKDADIVEGFYFAPFVGDARDVRARVEHIKGRAPEVAGLVIVSVQSGRDRIGHGDLMTAGTWDRRTRAKF